MAVIAVLRLQVRQHIFHFLRNVSTRSASNLATPPQFIEQVDYFPEVKVAGV